MPEAIFGVSLAISASRDLGVRLQHQLAHSLFRQRQAVQLSQLTAGQRRSKISVVFADDLNRTFSKSIEQLVVAGH